MVIQLNTTIEGGGAGNAQKKISAPVCVTVSYNVVTFPDLMHEYYSDFS